MAIDSLTTLDKLTKIQYLPGLQKWINTRRPFLGRLYQLTKEEWTGGRNMTMAVEYANAQSVSNISEGGLIADPQGTGIENMTLAMKYYYASARLTAQAIHSATSDASGFARSVKTVLDSVKDQLKDTLWIDATFGDGSGAIAEVASYSTPTVTLKDQPTVGELGSSLLRVNQYVSGYQAKTGGSVTANCKQVLTKTQTTFTSTATAGFTANDFLFRCTSDGATPTPAQTEDPRNKAVMGISGIVDDTTYVTTFQGLSRSTYPSLNANVLGNAGVLRAWTPELMDQAAMQAWGNGGGGYPTVIYSQLALQQRAASYLRTDRLYDGRMMELDGGWSGVQWTFPGGRIPWYADNAVRPNNIFFLDEDDLFLAVWRDVEEAAEDGRMWRYVDRRDAPECWLRCWLNVGARACNNHTVLRDMSQTA